MTYKMDENTPTNQQDIRDVYSVSEINTELKHTITANFPILWVEGEISNLAQPASGHIYFSLKDSSAQIRCVMFRSSKQRVPFKISNGLQVVIRAKVSLYEARGDLQLIADNMEEAGFGVLQRKFDALKKKLFSEGLFSEDIKKPIPQFPAHVAIITSPSGAAIKDYLHIAHRRYPFTRRSIYSVPVQGEQAANIISAAIDAVNRDESVDIIVLIRGGGSIEDLWAFNDEDLARKIRASRKPVITGIGHEIDYTIADLVADVRAPTPSAAAELTSPDSELLIDSLNNIKRSLHRRAIDIVNTCMQSTDWLSSRLQRTHPLSLVKEQNKSLQSFMQRLRHSSSILLKDNHLQFQSIHQRLKLLSPKNQITQSHNLLRQHNQNLLAAVSRQYSQLKHRFQLSTTTLNTVSPLNTLNRGYSISVKNQDLSNVISTSEQLSPGDQLTTYFSTGSAVTRVESTSSKMLAELIDTDKNGTNQD